MKNILIGRVNNGSYVIHIVFIIMCFKYDRILEYGILPPCIWEGVSNGKPIRRFGSIYNDLIINGY